MQKIIVIFTVLLAVLTVGQCASSSVACQSGPDGQMRCVRQSDSNGNVATSYAVSNGQQGQMAAGAGRPVVDYDVNYGRTGY